MSANNPFYAEMDRNPICIDIPWYDNPDQLAAFEEGRTGFPLIDAGIRQMKEEGWIHHIIRWIINIIIILIITIITIIIMIKLLAIFRVPHIVFLKKQGVEVECADEENFPFFGEN